MSSKDNKCLPDLIILKDEITFLRNEVQSKDKIIELIIKDKYNDSAEKNASFVGKSTITKTESKIITENNITNDQKFKLNEKVASNKKRTTVILGDSIIKDVEQHKIRKGLNNKELYYTIEKIRKRSGDFTHGNERSEG